MSKGDIITPTKITNLPELPNEVRIAFIRHLRKPSVADGGEARRCTMHQRDLARSMRVSIESAHCLWVVRCKGDADCEERVNDVAAPMLYKRAAVTTLGSFFEGLQSFSRNARDKP